MSGNNKQFHLLLIVLTMFVSFFPIHPNTDNHNKSEKDNLNKSEEVADIYLNFEDATLSSVVNYLAEQKKINLIPHKDLENKKVSLSTREPLTLSRAWTMLLTLLEINDFTIINVDDLYRIVPSKTTGKEPLPVYSSNKGIGPEDLPDSDLVVRYIYFLKNISIEIAQKILDDMLEKGRVTYNKDLKACIMTEKCFKIKSAMTIVKALDTGGMSESIQMVQLKHTDAEKIASLFNEKILNKQEGGKKKNLYFPEDKKKKNAAYFSGKTRIIPEPRQNALILLGTKENISKIIEFINKYIDVPQISAGSRIHVKEIKHVKASTLKKILTQIIVPPKGKGKTSIVGEYKFFEDVKIEDETPQKDTEDRGQGNRLIIACNHDDWARLEQLINKLDKPQPQIALEVMIVDINNKDEKELGSQIHAKTGQSFFKGMNAYTGNLKNIKSGSVLQSNLAEIPATSSGDADSQGSSWVMLGNAANQSVWAVIKSFLKKASSNIIAQPFLVTKSGQECTFEVKTTKHIKGGLKGEYTKSVVYKEAQASTNIKLKPHINTDGIITLDINATIDEFQDTEQVGGFPQSNRTISTQAIVAVGEILVLGGLTKDKTSDTKYKTPLLGDIPVIGNLFKSKSRTVEQDNLYIFIRPSIIKPQFEGSPDEYTQLKLDYAKYQILNAEKQRFERDPIQRWYFKPEGKTVKQTLSDLAQNRYRPIDDYIQSKNMPRSVRISEDEYYRTSENISKKTSQQNPTSEEKEIDKSKDMQYLVAKNKPANTLFSNAITNT